jgi:hypothetical protein
VPALIRLTAKLPLELREFRYAIAAVSTHLKMCSSSSAGPVRLRLVNIDRHPFFVFGEHRVRLLQVTEFARFVRRNAVCSPAAP